MKELRTSYARGDLSEEEFEECRRVSAAFQEPVNEVRGVIIPHRPVTLKVRP